MVEKEDGKLYIHNSYGPFLEELAELNDEVLFYQYKMRTDKADFQDYCVNDRNFKVRALKRSKLKIFSYIRAYIYGIYLLTKYDALYIFYPNNFKFLGFVAKIFGKKLGFYIRGEVGINSGVSKALYRKADIALTVSPAFTKLVTDCGGKSDTIRPMISFSEKDIVRDREYKTKSVYKILFLARMEFEKGIRELISAVGMLKDAGITNFHLEMVGHGNHSGEIERMCSESGLEDLVTFHGNQSGKDKIRDFFFQSDIYILPTYNEGFPRTLYEAMAYGTPIVTTLVGGIPYLMKNNVNCLAIQPQSAESIYETLRSVIKNYEQVIPIAENATNTISDYIGDHTLSHAQLLHQYLDTNK